MFFLLRTTVLCRNWLHENGKRGGVRGQGRKLLFKEAIRYTRDNLDWRTVGAEGISGGAVK